MNIRPLSQAESQNLSCVNRAGFQSALLFTTETGLRKSIFDATEPIRELLKGQGVHDYSQQGQGNGHKRNLRGIVHENHGATAIAVTVYRPVTKNGDPRIWFSRFKNYAAAGDACAIFVHERQPHVVNLTRSKLAVQMVGGQLTQLTSFFAASERRKSAVAEELLRKLREIASGPPIKAECAGSTAVGRSIEAALGITMNSARAPDYWGIELKSGRAPLARRENRATLFACVPDWTLSRCKSSKQILEEFGYQRGEVLKLYCTVSARGPNAQGLVFHIEEAQRLLRERCMTHPVCEVAVWRLPRLESSLAAKHRETFWIKAKSVSLNGCEHFRLQSVIHTRNPNLPQLERLLQSGSITMDHLIKRKPSGGAHEKGPLFKIERARIRELFLGEPAHYDLV